MGVGREAVSAQVVYCRNCTSLDSVEPLFFSPKIRGGSARKTDHYYLREERPTAPQCWEARRLRILGSDIGILPIRVNNADWTVGHECVAPMAGLKQAVRRQVARSGQCMGWMSCAKTDIRRQGSQTDRLAATINKWPGCDEDVDRSVR